MYYNMLIFNKTFNFTWFCNHMSKLQFGTVQQFIEASIIIWKLLVKI